MRLIEERVGAQLGDVMAQLELGPETYPRRQQRRAVDSE